jgi:outer membrane protein OmpA-like peptidoglycan-associated protein
MAEKRRTSLKATIGGTCFLTLFIAPVAITSIATKSQNAQAQQTDGVSVNLDVLDDLNPISKTPRLLMPRMTPRNGRVALTPPPGLGRISQQPSRVVLRPPPGAPQRLTTAVKIAVPRRAPAAVTPPVSVTTAPSAPEMVSDAVPPQSPTPIIELKDSEQTAQAQDSITEEQTSALPAPSLNDEPISITFGVDETDLPSSADSTLVPLAERMQSNENVGVQILAYASKTNGSVSSVRRKSLSRALSVRKFLMDRGIQSTRIEVRALGDKNEGGAPDRIDAIFQQR